MGSEFIRSIATKETGYEYLAIDSLQRSPNQNAITAALKYPNIEFKKADISNVNEMRSVFNDRKIVGLINFAAETHVDFSFKNVGLFYKSNTKGVQVLLECVRAYTDSDFKKFVQVSTDEVYGEAAEKPFSESDTLAPSNPYSASKAAAELLCLDRHSLSNLPVTIIRSCNSFGPYQLKEKFIPVCIRSCMQSEKIPIYGNGEQTRNWLPVAKHAKAAWQAFLYSGNSVVFNVGASNELANRALALKIANHFGFSEEILEMGHSNRLVHDQRYRMDSSLAAKEIGFEAEFDLDSEIRRTVNWYQKNSGWLNR